MSKARPSRTRRLLRAVTGRAKRSDDKGATLLMALIYITVVSVVVGAILALVDSSLRATVAVRAQASQAAAADGAAQAAINALRKNNYQGLAGTHCFGGTTDNLSLGNFYQPVNGTAYSATVSCAFDSAASQAGTGVIVNSQTKPANSILTLSKDNAEDGIYLHTYLSGDIIQVHGDMFSNSNIDVDAVKSDATVKARGNCSSGVKAVTKLCNLGNVADPAGNDPNYDFIHATLAAPATVPTCNIFSPNKVYVFNPGTYTNVSALNNLTNLLCNGTYYFKPGVYFFDFGGEWSVDSGTIVAGTTTQYGTSPPSTWNPSTPNACRSPIPPDPLPAGWTSPGAGAGVQFVFGGESRIRLANAEMEICGSYSPTSPPIAVYGLKSDYTNSGRTIHKQSGCITAAASSFFSSHCSVLSSTFWSSNEMYVRGTTYTPLDAIDMQLEHSSAPVFEDGVIARHFSFTSVLSNSLYGPISHNPDDTLGNSLTMLYLKVYVCPGTTACSTSGSTQLTVKVGLADANGTPSPGARQVTVYDWSIQR